MIVVTSHGMFGIPYLQEMLGDEVLFYRHGPLADGTKVAGWGLKPTAIKSRQLAVRTGLIYLSLEDGFLRSVGLGKTEPPLSIVVDDVGIYYDATQPSRLESLIARALTDAEAARAHAVM